jgi:hypothetical protein
MAKFLGKIPPTQSLSIWRLCFATALSVTYSWAVTATIGVASGPGTFNLDGTKVGGNANVFEGSQIQTGGAPSRVYLESGDLVTLGFNSTGTFYKDRVLLQKGATRVTGMNQYQIEVAPYRIQSADGRSEAVVRLDGGEVQIAALSGAVNVLDQRGALLTRIGAGTTSSFQTSDNTAAAGRSGANSGQTGTTGATSEEERRKRRRRETALYLTLGTTLAGLGLAVDAILQPGSGPSPTSP